MASIGPERGTRIGNPLVRNRITLVSGLVGLFLLLAAISPGASADQHLGFGTLTALVAVFLLRTTRVGVVVSEESLEVVGYFTTRDVSWRDVQEVKVVDLSGGTGFVRCVGLVLRSGSIVPLRSTAAYEFPKVEQYRRELDRRRSGVPNPPLGQVETQPR